MAKGTRNKITDSKITHKEVIHNNRMDTEGRTRVTRTGTKMLTAHKIDNMIHEASNGQEAEDLHSNLMDMVVRKKVTLDKPSRITARKTGSMIPDTSNDRAEVATHLRTDQDRRDHHHHPTRTIEGILLSLAVNLLSLEGMIHGTATHSNVQATKLKVQSGFSKIQETATESGRAYKMAETGQTKDQLLRNLTVGLVRQCHHQRNRRKVQWRSGRPKKRQDCTRMRTSQR
jgi:hypothetical protein